MVGAGETLVDTDIGVTRLFVVKLTRGVVITKTSLADGQKSALILHGDVPVELQAVEPNTAECYVTALRRALLQPVERAGLWAVRSSGGHIGSR